jgi:hypothetical protein
MYGNTTIMPSITESHFIILLQQIKDARSLSSYEQAKTQLLMFTPDDNFFKLAIVFNECIKKYNDFNYSSLSFDLEHFKMLMHLREGAKAVNKEISTRDKSLNHNLHYSQLSSMVDTFKNTAHYEYYCDYFYKEIFTPLSQFNPRIQYQAPDCVLHSMSKIKGANLIFSTHVGLRNNYPSTPIFVDKHNEPVLEDKRNSCGNGTLDEKFINCTTSKKPKLSSQGSPSSHTLAKPKSSSEDQFKTDDESNLLKRFLKISPYSSIYQTRLEVIQKKSIRVRSAIQSIFNKPARSNSTIKDNAKSYFLDRIIEILEELDQSTLISEHYEGVNIKALLNGDKEFEILLSSILLGKRIYLMDTEQELSPEIILQKAGYYPVMLRSITASGEEQYKLLYINPENDRLKCITFNTAQIDYVKKILFSQPSQSYKWLCVDLTKECREALLLFTHPPYEEKQIKHKDVLYNQAKKLNINRAFFAAALIYILDKNKFTLESITPSEKEAQNSFNKLLAVLQNSQNLGKLKKNLSAGTTMDYFIEGSNTAGMMAADPWAFQYRYGTQGHQGRNLRPSPQEMLTGNGLINNTSFAQEFFQQLISRFRHKATIRTIMKEGVEMGHSAHASRVVQWVNALVWVIQQEVSNPRSNFGNSPLNLADLCAGGGNSLVAFGTLDKATLFQKTEINGKKIQVGKIYINDVNKKLIPIWEHTIDAYLTAKKENIILSTEPVEKFPKEKLQQLSNSLDISATSPPYGDREKYDPYEGEHQSWRYTNDRWSQEFLYPFIQNTVTMTRDGGWMILLVANVKGGVKVKDMAEQMMGHYCKGKVMHIGYDRSKGSRLQGQNSNDQAETFLIGKVDKSAKIETQLTFTQFLEEKKQPKGKARLVADTPIMSFPSVSALPQAISLMPLVSSANSGSALSCIQPLDPMLDSKIMAQPMDSFEPFRVLVSRINLLEPKRTEAILFFPSVVLCRDKNEQSGSRFMPVCPEYTTTHAVYYRLLREIFGHQVIQAGKHTPQQILDIFTQSQDGVPKYQMKEGVLLRGVSENHERPYLSHPSFWRMAALTIFTISTPQFFENFPAHQAEFLAIFEIFIRDCDMLASKKIWRKKCQNALMAFESRWPPTQEIIKIKQRLLSEIEGCQPTLTNSRVVESKSENISEKRKRMNRDEQSRVSTKKKSYGNSSELTPPTVPLRVLPTEHSSSRFFSVAPDIAFPFEELTPQNAFISEPEYKQAPEIVENQIYHGTAEEKLVNPTNSKIAALPFKRKLTDAIDCPNSNKPSNEEFENPVSSQSLIGDKYGKTRMRHIPERIEHEVNRYKEKFRYIKDGKEVPGNTLIIRIYNKITIVDTGEEVKPVHMCYEDKYHAKKKFMSILKQQYLASTETLPAIQNTSNLSDTSLTSKSSKLRTSELEQENLISTETLPAIQNVSDISNNNISFSELSAISALSSLCGFFKPSRPFPLQNNLAHQTHGL